jgi:hypothetical protein
MFQGLVGLTDRGQRDVARKLLERAQQLNLKVGDSYTAGLIDYAFGLYWRWSGHAQHALPYFRRSVNALHKIGEVANLSIALLHIARILAGGDALAAAQLAGAALAIGARGHCAWRAHPSGS